MKLIRRIHLYAGLLMFPWVLLYGFTALLFNHSTLLPEPDTSIHRFQAKVPESAGMPAAAAMAELVVGELNAEHETDGRPAYRLVNPQDSTFTHPAIGTARTGGSRYTLVMNLGQGDGYVRQRQDPRKDENEEGLTPLEQGRTVSVPVEELREKVRKTMSETLKELGLEHGAITFRTVPAVEFDLEENGEIHRARFASSRRRPVAANTARPGKGIQSGRVTLVGKGTQELGWRSYLLRLHTSRGYPAERNARWFWAIAVDAMFVTMTFWGLSGLFMWWQLKRTRRLGALCLLVSAVAATWLAFGMHAQLVR